MLTRKKKERGSALNQYNQPKAIFLDMDGTVLDHYNRISIHTKEAIATIREKGIPIFIATGRSREEVFAVFPEGFQVDGVISSNGMTAYLGDEKIQEHSLPHELVTRIIEKAREHHVYYELFPTEGIRVVLKQDYPIIEKEAADPKPESVGINEWIERKEALKTEINWQDQLPKQTYSKFYCFSKAAEHIEKWKQELEQLKEWMDFTTSSSSIHNVEIMVAGVNKATGIQALLNQLDILPEDILVIGDSHNDIPMFTFAGQTVAMQNAAPEIKALADEITTFSCDEDGVSQYLKQRFLK